MGSEGDHTHTRNLLQMGLKKKKKTMGDAANRKKWNSTQSEKG